MAFTINGEEVVYPIGYYTPTGERKQPTVSDGEVDLTIDLSGVVNPVVTYYRDTGKTNIENVINRPVGYRSAYHPEDIVPFFNTLTLGGLNNLSPTLWLRRGYDTGKLLNGNMNWTDYTNSWINGNNGIFTDLQAAAHPIWAAIGNGAADILTLGGAGLLKSTAGQYRAGQAATLAFNNGTWDYIVGTTSPNTGLRTTLAESPWVSENFLTVIKPQVRTKVGDVEIDNPGLYYHQSGAGKALNFVSTGRMRTPTEEYWLAKEKAGERIPLSLRSGIEPGYPQSPGQTMFSLGELWYGITPNNNPDLLVTAKEMPIANKNASVMTGKASLRELENQGSRRVTSDNIYGQGPHNRLNTSAYTWEPGYGYRRVSSEKTPTIIEWTDAVRAPQITSENAANITPEQWTAAQDAAIARGDMAEAQRLRDLHFKTYQNGDMVDVNGNPIHVYHGSPEENITEFYKPNDPRLPTPKGTNYKATGEEGIYTSPRKGYAANYMADLGGRYRIPLTKEQKALLKAGKTREEIGLPSIPQGRIYDLYSNTKLVPEDLNIDFDPFTLSTKEAELIKSRGYSGFDIPGKKYPEHVVLEPNQLKLADAVTYDDKGVRIPLGMRDNFNINDIRYGLLPFLGLGAAGTLYGNLK